MKAVDLTLDSPSGYASPEVISNLVNVIIAPSNVAMQLMWDIKSELTGHGLSTFKHGKALD